MSKSVAQGCASVAGGRMPGATVVCPSCGKPVPWTSEQVSRPFCSERCRLIDLGEWASNTRRIPVDESPQDEPAQ